MKSLLKIFSVAALVIAIALPAFEVKAKTNSFDNHDDAHKKLEAKIKETTQTIAKDIGLDEKQAQKVYDIKLEEAKAIENVRADKDIAPSETKNKILLIKNDANTKVSKVLTKEQKVLWDAKNKNYEYNPGFIENVKDKYQEKKEDIQERREEKREDK